MTMNVTDIKDKWKSFQNKRETQQRIDPDHPLDFFIGINEKGNAQLILLTTIEPSSLKSGSAIEVDKNQRKDGRWATQITSLQKANEDIFARLCLDLIESSQNCKSEKEGLECVIKRFISWQKLFSNIHKDLSKEVLKGMVGEINFAIKMHENGLSWDDVLNAWIGPEGADRDYVFPDKWYEIKSIASGKDYVTISSLNQLDTDSLGYLCIYRVDESSKTDPQAYNINMLIKKVRNLLESYPVELQLFEQKLISIGYMDKNTYEEIYFTCKQDSFYRVENDFPKLIPDSVPSQITGATYNLSIAAIKDWKVQMEQIWN